MDDVPDPVTETVTSTVPVPAGAVTVIVVEVAAVIVAEVEPKSTVSLACVAEKPVPWTTTEVPLAPAEGESDVTAGGAL